MLRLKSDTLSISWSYTEDVWAVHGSSIMYHDLRLSFDSDFPLQVAGENSSKTFMRTWLPVKPSPKRNSEPNFEENEEEEVKVKEEEEEEQQQEIAPKFEEAESVNPEFEMIGYEVNDIEDGNVPIWTVDVVSAGSLPLCDTVMFASVRIVTNSNSTDRWGGWSPPSPPWNSLSLNACSEDDKYFDCASSDKPKNWVCQNCPLGAWCRGSVNKQEIKAKDGFWRDARVRNNASRTELADWIVPFEKKFVQCKNPRACLGSLHNESCNEDEGYLETCCGSDNIDGEAGCGRCRLCQTCKVGYAMEADGITCTQCSDESGSRTMVIIGSFFIFIVVMIVFGTMIYLKVNSVVKGETAERTASHSTVQRILLSHMQVVMLCMQLNVPWPYTIRLMMSAFSSLSSLSNHVSVLGCVYDIDLPVRKQARFLYTATQSVMSIPILVALTMWVYWMVLLKVPCLRGLACGNAKHLRIASCIPYPKKICGSEDDDDSDDESEDDESELDEEAAGGAMTLQRRMTMLGGGFITQSKSEQKERQKEEKRNQKKLAKAAARKLDTLDIWSYCMVLFLFMMYPSLVRFPMYMLSCIQLHVEDPTTLEVYGNASWVTRSYLRADVEEVCWVGEHLENVGLVAVPGFLIYGMGLPVLAFLLLFRKRRKLHSKKYSFRLGLLCKFFSLFLFVCLLRLFIHARAVRQVTNPRLFL
jgi:hypothetical protein